MPGDIVQTGGWCAPAATLFEGFTDLVEPERWPPGLTEWDLRWLAEMLWVAEIDIPAERWFDLPTISIRRGGIRFPMPEPDIVSAWRAADQIPTT